MNFFGTNNPRNSCIPAIEGEKITADLNQMTIADLGKDSDLQFILKFLTGSDLVMHQGIEIDEIRRALQSIYLVSITPENPVEDEATSLPSLLQKLRETAALEDLMNKVAKRDGERISEIAFKTLNYLAVFK